MHYWLLAYHANAALRLDSVSLPVSFLQGIACPTCSTWHTWTKAVYHQTWLKAKAQTHKEGISLDYFVANSLGWGQASVAEL